MRFLCKKSGWFEENSEKFCIFVAKNSRMAADLRNYGFKDLWRCPKGGRCFAGRCFAGSKEIPCGGKTEIWIQGFMELLSQYGIREENI